jgi:type I restriction enzyme R subunit
VDLSGIDFGKLAGLFATNPKTATETLREAAEKKVREMVEANPTRKDFVGRLNVLMAQYNS